MGTQVCPWPSLSSPHTAVSPWPPSGGLAWGSARQLWGPIPSPTNTPPTLPGSSDDGDELQRCREAAVSASDILQESAIHGPVPVEKKKKRKLEKKAKNEDSADVASIATSKAAVGRQERSLPSSTGTRRPLGPKRSGRKRQRRPVRPPCPRQQRVLLPCPRTEPSVQAGSSGFP